MHRLNKELFIFIKDTTINSPIVKQEIKKMNKMLLALEYFEYFYITNEIVDLNECRIIKEFIMVKQIVQQQTLKPYTFIINKN